MSSEPILEMGQNVPAYVDELSVIKPMGAVTHLIFTARQPEAHQPDGFSRVVQLRMVIPTDQLNTIARAMLAREAAVRVYDDAREPVTH